MVESTAFGRICKEFETLTWNIVLYIPGGTVGASEGFLKGFLIAAIICFSKKPRRLNTLFK